MIKVFDLNKRSNFLKHFINNYCCRKDAMKKIFARVEKRLFYGGVPTIPTN